MNQWYLGVYAQDTWRTTDRVTLNAGLRWEPFFGQNIENGAISNFVLDNFRQGIKTTRFQNAPAGLIYPGDPGFPDGKAGMNRQWRNFSPRVGRGVGCDRRRPDRGSLVVRMNYDFPSAVYLYIAASASPFANRVELSAVPFEDPYRNVPGGDTHPLSATPPFDAQFPAFGAYGVMDPDINSARVQSWNVTLERQLGAAWQVSASYLGSYADRLWGQVHINPGDVHGAGTLHDSRPSYPVVHGHGQRRSPAHAVSRESGRGTVARAASFAMPTSARRTIAA